MTAFSVADEQVLFVNSRSRYRKPLFNSLASASGCCTDYMLIVLDLLIVFVKALFLKTR